MKKDIKLLYNNDADKRTYKGFKSLNNTSTLTGIKSLLQKISKILLTQVGSDWYNPNLGTNIPSLLATSGGSNINDIEPEILAIVGNIEDTIKNEQVADFSLDASEILVSINLENVEFSNNGDEMYITLFVTTSEGGEHFLRI